MNQIARPNRILSLGAVLAALAVALGAFGAHGLEGHFEKTLDDRVKVERRLDIWETGVRYQMYHSLALLALGLTTIGNPRLLRIACIAFITGIVVFSGCLYALTLTDIKILGAIVPLGGLSFLLGWALFAYATWKAPA